MGERVYETRSDWFSDFRSNSPDYSVGASTVGSILGWSKWAGPWDVWSRAQEEGPRVDHQTDVQLRGHQWEMWLLDQWTRRTGVALDSRRRRCWSDDRPWLRVSPDATLADGSGIIEAKTAASAIGWGEDGLVLESWGIEAAQSIPISYAAQGMAQLAAIPTAGWVDFVVGLPDRVQLVDVRVIRLCRDQQAIDRLVGAVEAWRERHLVLGTPPPPEPTDEFYSWAATYDRAATPIDADEEQARVILDYRDLKAQIKALKAQAADLQVQLVAESAGSIGIQTTDPETGRRVLARIVTTAGRESLSLSNLKAAHPEWYSQAVDEGLVSTGRKSAHVRIF